MIDLVLNEDLWFPMATSVALIVTIITIVRQKRLLVQRRTRIKCGLNMFYGVLIGIMGCGHLIAVVTKMALGILPADTNIWFVIPLGLALAVPAWWLVVIMPGLAMGGRVSRNVVLALNAWLGAVLLLLGPPLAALAVVNLILLLTWKTDQPSSIRRKAL